MKFLVYNLVALFEVLSFSLPRSARILSSFLGAHLMLFVSLIIIFIKLDYLDFDRLSIYSSSFPSTSFLPFSLVSLNPMVPWYLFYLLIPACHVKIKRLKIQLGKYHVIYNRPFTSKLGTVAAAAYIPQPEFLSVWS